MNDGNQVSAIATTMSDLVQAYRDDDPTHLSQRQAEAVVTGPEGITVLTTETDVDGEKTALIRLSNDGEVMWERCYEPIHGAGRSLAMSDDGGCVIAGDIRRSVTEYQGHLLTVDAAGHVVGAQAIGPPGATGLVCITPLADSMPVAGGTAHWKGWLVRMSADIPADIPVSDLDDVTGLAARADGGFALAGIFDGSTTSLGRARIIACSADGATDWSTELPSSGRGELTAIGNLPDGSFAVAGHSVAEGQAKARLWVARLDTNGMVLWQRWLGPADMEQRGRAIAALTDGIAAAGDFVNGSLRRAHVVSLSLDGSVVWEQSFGAADRYSIVRGIAAVPGGLVLAGSTQQGGGKTEAWVIGIDATGRQQWERMFPCGSLIAGNDRRA